MTAANEHTILGINSAYHEPAAALIKNGRIIAAVEEERFSGRKHGKPVRVDNAHQLPCTSIQYCLDAARITWRDLDAVAYSLDPSLRLRHACRGSEGDPMTFGHPVGEQRFQESLHRVPQLIAELTDAPFFFVPHHDAHAWYAMGTSPFPRAAVLILDGIGEGASLSMGIATRCSLEIGEQNLFPASIGIAWEKVARFIGLTEYDACKVMALAGLARENGHEPFECLMGYREGELWMDQSVLRLEFPDDFSGLSRCFGARDSRMVDSADNRRLAAGIQLATERLLAMIVERLMERYGEKRLVYGGGVALNCRANATLAASTLADAIHVGPATHDAGTALGAAWSVHARLTGTEVPLQDPRAVVYSGPSIMAEEKTLQGAGWTGVGTGDGLADITDLLVRGELLGWLDGPCEFGPRALGARSLLSSPLVEDVVGRVNGAKGRRPFEPLAVSVLAEELDHVFHLPRAARPLADFMLTTARPTEPWRDTLRHAVHADGTLRIQAVRRENAPRLHRLLDLFARRTGVPLLVNTSFNPRGQPMPAGLARALRMADALGLGHVVVDGRLITHRESCPVGWKPTLQEIRQ